MDSMELSGTMAVEDGVDQKMHEKLDLEAGRSNNIIPDNEKEIVRALLSGAKQSVHQLDLEIAHIESTLTILRQQREDAASRVRRFQVALSAQKLLPEEILARIFVRSLQGGTVNLHHSERDIPWIYLRVCSRWRKVALSEHHLWNTLVADNSIDVTKAWLHSLWEQNSTSLVSLDTRGYRKSADIFDIVCRYSARLRNLSVGRFDTLISHFIENPLVDFEHLESLTLRWILSLPSNNSVMLFSRAPSLRSIVLTGMSPFPETGLDLPWSQLISLSFTEATPSPRTVYSILGQCPRLVDFTVAISEDPNVLDIIPMESPPDVILPDLRDLTFIMGTWGQLDDFIQHLVLPSLKNLSIKQDVPHFSEEKHIFPQDLFIAMLEKSPMVECLHLGCEFTNLRLISVLKKTPCLTTLSLHDKTIFSTGIFFNMMRRGEVLQNLERLECWTPSPHPVLELFERQCSPTRSLGHRGLYSMHITCYEVEDIIGVRTRFQALGRQLRNDGKIVLMKEIMIDQSLGVVFEGNRKL